MAVMAALSLLCDPQLWGELLREFDFILRNRRREPHSGLCRGRTCDDMKLSRLAICFVPSTVLNHWFRTAQSAVLGAKEIFGDVDVQVIKGDTRLHSIKSIYESKRPTIWVLPMESESMKVIQDHHEIGYAVCIMDELNMRMRSRSDQPESTSVFNYV